MMEQEKKRRFSLDDDFMKSRINAPLYGMLRCLSTAMPTNELTPAGNKKYKEYLPAETINNNRKWIMDVCGIGSVKTLNRHMELLQEKGLVELGKFESNGFTYPCYFFPFDYDGVYKLINKDLLFAIVTGLRDHALKIYLYLLNCSGMKENYEFTLNELKEALGYATSTKTVDKGINVALKMLQELKIIDFYETMKEYTDSNGKFQKKPIKVLRWIAVECPENLKVEDKTSE